MSETEALWDKLNTGKARPSWWVVAEKMRNHAQELEHRLDKAKAKNLALLEARRERDEAREEAKALLQALKERDEARAVMSPDRALEWLRSYYRELFGERKEWSEEIADRFYRDTATLTLFVQNFQFPKEELK
jgi:hypothetical protein